MYQAAGIARIDFRFIDDIVIHLCHRTALEHFSVVVLDVIAVDVVRVGIGNLSKREIMKIESINYRCHQHNRISYSVNFFDTYLSVD